MADAQQLEIKQFHLGITDNFVAADPRAAERLYNMTILEDQKVAMREGSVPDDERPFQSGPTLMVYNQESICRTPVPAYAPHQNFTNFGICPDPREGVERPISFCSQEAFYSGRGFPLAEKNDANKYLLEFYTGATFPETPSPLNPPRQAYPSQFAGLSDAGSRIQWQRWNDHVLLNYDHKDPTLAHIKGNRVHFLYYGASGASGGSDILQLRPAGLPALASNPTAPVAGTGGSYIYAFCYVYKYRINEIYFEVRGPVTTINSSFIGTVTAIPAFPSAQTDENYDTSGANPIKLEIYRTITGGQTPRYVTSIALGVNSYADVTPDGSLGAAIYTAGGVASNDPPPFCRFAHITELGTGYYGHYVDRATGVDGTTVESLIRNGFLQSKVGRPWAVPGSFGDEVDEELTGISSIKEVPLIFTKNRTYRVDGKIDDLGNGILQTKTISQDFGAVSHKGIVQTPVGVFFPSLVGFCYTDGYNVRKISDNLPTTYGEYFSEVDQSITGVYDPIRQRVFWSVKNNSGYWRLFVLHLQSGISPASAFTLWGAIETTDNAKLLDVFRADDLMFWKNTLFKLDSRGLVTKHRAGVHTDYRIYFVTNMAGNDYLPIQYGTVDTPVMYDWRSVATDFEQGSSKKWTPRFTTFFTTAGDFATPSLSIQPYVNRDGKPEDKILEGKLIRRTETTWGNSQNLWGDPALWDGTASLVSAMRRCPTPGIRASYRTFGLKNAFVQIISSTELGVGSWNSVSKALTLAVTPNPTLNARSYKDYYISFEMDGYTKEYLVTDLNTGSFVLLDTSLVPAYPPSQANVNWVLRGYKRGDSIHLSSVTMTFMAGFGGNLGPYRSGEEAGTPT